MELENLGVVTIELYPEYAPNTVANFIDLINQGYYNGLTFHRAVQGFMVQGGDKEGTGSGKVEETIEGEFRRNGFTQNTLKHERGVISMARSDYSSIGLVAEGYDSAFSQFFIMVANTSSLNGSYAAFGKVLTGMEYVDELVKVEAIQEKDETATTEGEEEPELTAEEQLALQPKITKMTVDTFGIDYGKPERQPAFDINAYFSQMYGL
ncbi:MAG: peptidylprolyl isomerase [Lachnospiraceae bacterium]|nr:peptidylprolyl isomerase [Lachnospiraceae bacterium]